ncbi:hypothetical protein PUR46_28665, partial [Klebsiella pneumoniae]|nr:hypothetical protein [Klebsiella pneumoniae]
PGRRGDTLHLAVEGLAVERVYGEGDRLANAYFGQLGQISVRLGAYVSAGTHLTSLVPPQHWVIANLKET